MATTNGKQAETLFEAPVSATIKMTYRKYDTMLTLRGFSGAEVLDKLDKAITWLENHGAEPTTSKSANGSLPNERICPEHGAKAKLREKSGDRWYSHKAYDEGGNEYWCRIEVD